MPHSANHSLVFITGCSSGIGHDAALRLQQHGYRVLASCRKPEDVQRLQQEGLDCIQLDLADSASVDAACAEVVMRHQTTPLWGLINNGAFGLPGAVEDLSRDALRVQFETNVFGTHQLTTQLLPLLREQNQGRIVQISSILGGLSLPFRGAYNASKHALEALSDTLRLELTHTGIQVALIEPGPIKTRFRDNSLALFEQHIDMTNSPFKRYYEGVLGRLGSDKPVPFTLPASAVSAQILHALNARQAKIRYHTTWPTRVFLPLKRVMPDRWFDRLLLKLGDKPPK